ncbi:IFT80 (predicted) [Pycnogonum litorale]
MKFKVTLEKEPKHSELVSCVGWSGTDELYSCGEDHVILCWSQIKSDTTKVTDLYNDLYPTDMHWFPKSVAGGGAASKKLSSSSDLFVLTAADGKFHFISKNGRVEKTIDGHKGAVLCGRWSFDATALLTGGEDGLIKIWSRSGMLRSTLASNSLYIYESNHP